MSLEDYDSTHRAALKRIAQVFGLEPEQVFLTAGADDGLPRMPSAFSPSRDIACRCPPLR